MGIADVGLNGSGGSQPYGTDEFVGVATVSYLSAVGPADSTCGLTVVLSLQLNVVLLFYLGNSPYYYWIQNVVAFNIGSSQTSSTVVYTDEIWNFTAFNADMLTSSFSGNGRLDTSAHPYDYYYCPSSSLSGNDALVSYSNSNPATLRLQVNELVSGNVPVVTFSYYSTVTGAREVYDSVSFPFAHNPNFPQFWVSAVGYNPAAFNDAELVFGGSGGGANATLQGSTSLVLHLEYDPCWNGILEYVPNAYNYGVDTGEAVANAVATGLQDPVGVSIGASIVNSYFGPVYWSDIIQFYTSSNVPNTLQWTYSLSGPDLLNTEGLPGSGNNGETDVPDGPSA